MASASGPTPEVPVVFFTPGTCALACIAALEWRGTPFDACLVQPHQRSEAAYRRVNARGQVPALAVDGHVLTEVNAILAHVADREPSAAMLPPNGSWARDVANQWLSHFASGVHPVFWPYYHPERWTADAAGVDAVKRKAIDSIARELGTMNEHLARNEYVLGSEPSILDPYLFAMARWGSDMLDLASFGHLHRHMKRMSADPHVRVALAVERGRDVGPSVRGFRRRLSLADIA